MSLRQKWGKSRDVSENGVVNKYSMNKMHIPSPSMALLISLFLSALIFTEIKAEIPISNSNDESKNSDSTLRLQLDQLDSKISLLESAFDEKNHELETKNEHVKRLEVILEDKSSMLASKEIKSFEEEGYLDVKQQIEKADARASELQKQISNLEKEIESQNKKKDALDARANVAEKRIQERNAKLESLQKIYDGQKSKIQKTERALQAAEEEMIKAKMEAASLAKRLSEARGSWLPAWLEVHYIHYQSVLMSNWNKHGIPVMDLTIQKALEQKAKAEKWSEPHVETLKTILPHASFFQWMPIIKQHSFAFVSDTGLYAKSLGAKATDLYYESKRSVEPHIIQVKEAVDPYYQEAKRFTQPYVDQVSVVMKPYLEKAQILFNPYTKKMARKYKKAVKVAAKYHDQVEARIHETLKENELTKSIATKETSWYLASTVLALPVIFFLNLVSGCLRTKPKKRTRNSQSAHTRQKGKRVHSGK
ncbi:hypothetical protein Leryth_002396 [Lithospermum erythrorhizon]|nr:hypothetical protein Leryth_002396 [Lithospermum erythrorhizon]